eukprot:516104-Alexandrium_andersonii.AAC.1
MSASLVGSEMCIRDSLRATPEITSAGHRESPLAHARARLGATSASEYIPCLLYTSDAADDM